ncbi:MAG: sulfotransferase [Flavobacteriaceae bacterium]|nr:sulfotransferase [Flavobacteriaceae bacterium]
MNKIFYIVGSGRSGTHWLLSAFESNPNIKIVPETYPLFQIITKSAQNQIFKKSFYWIVLSYYRIKMSFTSSDIVDKSHPNLWNAESINRCIKNSYFIGIYRDPHATISSMLLHSGVLRWVKNWKFSDGLNRFLGITENNIEEYESYSIERKCFTRWLATYLELYNLKNQMHEKVYLISYEDLFENSDDEIEKLKIFTGLKLEKPIIDLNVKDKWRNNLNETQITEINMLLKENNLHSFVKEI